MFPPSKKAKVSDSQEVTNFMQDSPSGEMCNSITREPESRRIDIETSPEDVSFMAYYKITENTEDHPHSKLY